MMVWGIVILVIVVILIGAAVEKEKNVEIVTLFSSALVEELRTLFVEEFPDQAPHMTTATAHAVYAAYRDYAVEKTGESDPSEALIKFEQEYEWASGRKQATWKEEAFDRMLAALPKDLSSVLLALPEGRERFIRVADAAGERAATKVMKTLNSS